MSLSIQKLLQSKEMSAIISSIRFKFGGFCIYSGVIDFIMDLLVVLGLFLV